MSLILVAFISLLVGIFIGLTPWAVKVLRDFEELKAKVSYYEQKEDEVFIGLKQTAENDITMLKTKVEDFFTGKKADDPGTPTPKFTQS